MKENICLYFIPHPSSFIPSNDFSWNNVESQTLSAAYDFERRTRARALFGQ